MYIRKSYPSVRDGFTLAFIPGSDIRGLFLLIILSALLSFFSIAEYLKVAQSALAEIDVWHNANIRGLAASPLQQRILSFIIPDILNKLTGLSFFACYILERFTFLFLSSISIICLSSIYLGFNSSLAVGLLFFFFYNLTCLSHIQPAEEINILFFSVCYILIERQRFYGLILAGMIGATAKQTIVFIVPIYIAYNLIRSGPGWGLLWRSFALGAAIVLVISIISIYYSDYEGRPYLGGFFQYYYNTRVILNLDVQALLFLFVTIIPSALIIKSWSCQPALVRSAVLVMPFYLVPHYLISKVDEFRTFMPLFVLIDIGIVIYIQSMNGSRSRSKEDRALLEEPLDLRVTSNKTDYFNFSCDPTKK